MRDFVRIYEVELPVAVERVWAFHGTAEALEVLTPKSRQLTPISTDLTVREGAEHAFRFRQFGIPMVWRARIHDVHPPREFTDDAIQSPFPRWSHHHEFISLPNGRTRLRDTVTYMPPGGILAGIVNMMVVGKQLDALFAFRHKATREYFQTK